MDIPPEEVERKGRLMPGNIFLVDFDKHAVVTDEDMKRAVSTKRPYGEWLASQTVTLQVSFRPFFSLSHTDLHKCSMASHGLRRTHRHQLTSCGSCITASCQSASSLAHTWALTHTACKMPDA